MPTLRWISSLLLLAYALSGAIAPALADDGEPDSERGGKAMLSGTPGFRNRDLFELEFVAIDGRNISPRSILWVEPGRRTVTVRVPDRFTESLINQRRQKWPEWVEIELDLLPDHGYEIRGRFNRTDRDNPYDIVVDRVQDFRDD
jgi:hypothetical protein